ncbi:MAG: rod shape-determining protein MreD [Armatimonadetes bacterium]|nr:rod shape-determining protein MreD [Armatimonadota bacterium]
MLLFPSAPAWTRIRPTPLRMAALTVMVAGAAVLQSSFLTPLDVPYVPHLTFLVAVVGAWFAGAWGGAWMGLWAGLVMAALSGKFVGSFTFSYLVVGWLVGRAREEIYGDWPALVPFIAGMGTLLAEALFFLWNPRHLSGEPLRPFVVAGWNALYALPIYLPMMFILRRLGRTENYGFDRKKG